MVKKKKSVKKIYIKPKEDIDYSKKFESEIKELEAKRASVSENVKPGFFGKIAGTFQRGSINKQIYLRKQIISTQKRQQLANIQNKLAKENLELQKTRNALKLERDKSKISYEDLMGTSSGKSVKTNDIFGY